MLLLHRRISKWTLQKRIYFSTFRHVQCLSIPNQSVVDMLNAQPVCNFLIWLLFSKYWIFPYITQSLNIGNSRKKIEDNILKTKYNANIYFFLYFYRINKNLWIGEFWRNWCSLAGLDWTWTEPSVRRGDFTLQRVEGLPDNESQAFGITFWLSSLSVSGLVWCWPATPSANVREPPLQCKSQA